MKYERGYLRAYDSVAEANSNIAEYIEWCNLKRGHTSLADMALDQECWKQFSKPVAA